MAAATPLRVFGFVTPLLFAMGAWAEEGTAVAEAYSTCTGAFKRHSCSLLLEQQAWTEERTAGAPENSTCAEAWKRRQRCRRAAARTAFQHTLLLKEALRPVLSPSALVGDSTGGCTPTCPCALLSPTLPTASSTPPATPRQTSLTAFAALAPPPTPTALTPPPSPTTPSVPTALATQPTPPNTPRARFKISPTPSYSPVKQKHSTQRCATSVPLLAAGVPPSAAERSGCAPPSFSTRAASSSTGATSASSASAPPSFPAPLAATAPRPTPLGGHQAASSCSSKMLLRGVGALARATGVEISA